MARGHNASNNSWRNLCQNWRSDKEKHSHILWSWYGNAQIRVRIRVSVRECVCVSVCECVLYGYTALISLWTSRDQATYTAQKSICHVNSLHHWTQRRNCNKQNERIIIETIIIIITGNKVEERGVRGALTLQPPTQKQQQQNETKRKIWEIIANTPKRAGSDFRALRYRCDNRSRLVRLDIEQQQ